MTAGPVGRTNDPSSNAGGGSRRRRRGRGHKRGGRGRSGKNPAAEGDLSSAPEPKNDVERAARRMGIRKLHAEQELGIEAVRNGQDVLMVLPTGFGKSAVYQTLSMLLDKPVILVSPLLALLRDQHEKLIKHNIPCVRLDGTVRGKARAAALDRVREGGSLLVMTTPETLGSDEFASVIAESGVSLAAIDEAHCISEWGYDFRPAYQRLGERLRAFGAPRLMALTATATEKVREDIVRFLGMRDPKVVSSSPHRSNLAFEVMICRDTTARLRALARLAQRLRRPGIIYCTTTKEVDTVYAMLMKLGIPAHRYHGKMNAGDRNAQQELFMKPGRRTVMVATSAFGLGIDKPDIRYVVHQQSPASLEQYVQEAGRSGRDGAKSNCILLHDPEDRGTHEALLARSRLRPEQLYRLGRALAAWAGEGRTPDVSALALSAELGDRATTALLVPIEEAGIVEFDEQKVSVTTSPDQVEERVSSLAGQFENLRTQDSRRLDSLADYAGIETCRAEYLRSYFGEEGGEPCGLCDICRGRPERPSTFFQAIAAPPKRGKRRRRRKGNQQGGGGSSNPSQRNAKSASGDEGQPQGSGSRRSRRNRRRRRRGGNRKDGAGSQERAQPGQNQPQAEAAVAAPGAPQSGPGNNRRQNESTRSRGQRAAAQSAPSGRASDPGANPSGSATREAATSSASQGAGPVRTEATGVSSASKAGSVRKAEQKSGERVASAKAPALAKEKTSAAVEKKAPVKKKAAAAKKKTAAVKKKTAATKKKTAAVKKTATKKKTTATAKKKTATKKKTTASVKKKSVATKKTAAVAKKATTAKKKTVAKKKTATKKKAAAKKKS